MKSRALFAILVISFFTTFAQKKSSLYIPRNIQDAYTENTRSFDGKPGERYWQNSADYDIKAELFPSTRILKGEENIIYHNNSPFFIGQVVFRLYQDLYKTGSKRDRFIDPSDVGQGVNIDQININGKPVKVTSSSYVRRSGTLMFVSLLSSSVEKGQSVSIDIKWSFKIDKNTLIRMGAYDSTSFFVGYWYPRIAVYDDIDGWDENEYNGQNEFYEDFCNFKVAITVPKNYLVWGSGVVEDAQKIFSKDVYAKYQKALTSDSIIHVVSSDDIKNKRNVTIDKPKITYQFKTDSVYDFAFATSNHYCWDATSVTVDNNTNRNTLVSAAYKQSSTDFVKVANIAKATLKYLSTEMPAVPYPFPQMTVFNGGDGMEYVMIVNDRSCSTWSETVHLTSHEISHTYFPFYMGINQYKYAWMDEGWAMFLPSEFQTNLAPSVDQAMVSARTYNAYAGKELDAPLMQPSFNIRNYEYYIASYYRPEMAYRFLEDLLGKDLFKKCLQTFIERWHGKHPIPYDFFFTFDNVAGEDLSWYWNPWFFERGYPDLAIKSAVKDSTKYTIEIENVGTMPIPIQLRYNYADGTFEYEHKTPRVWKMGLKTYTIEKKSDKPIKSIELGNPQIPDVDLKNNFFTFDDYRK